MKNTPQIIIFLAGIFAIWYFIFYKKEESGIELVETTPEEAAQGATGVCVSMVGDPNFFRLVNKPPGEWTDDDRNTAIVILHNALNDPDRPPNQYNQWSISSLQGRSNQVHWGALNGCNHS